MTDISKFRGTGVAVVTPFQPHNGEIDYEAFGKVIDFLIEGKVEYIVAIGTTGESPVISDTERQEIIDFLAHKINQRIPLVVGIGGNNTAEVIKKIKNTRLTKVDALLSVCPYYNKPGQAGIIAHYKAVAEASPLPVIMYNVPGRTSVNITADTTLHLAHTEKKIIGMKEASGNMTQIMDIIRKKPENFLLISGDDMLTLPIIAAGGDGIISVVANVCPRDFSEMVRHALAYRMKEAQQLHYKLFDLIIQIFADGSPAGVKAAMHIRGLISNSLRLPLVPVNETVYKKLEQLLAAL